MDDTVENQNKPEEQEEVEAHRRGNTKTGCCSRLRSTTFLLYCSHALSAWGDRMWQFATGMFLIALSPGSLRLTAVYGFTSGGAILFLGAIVGDIVDRKPRLTVARTSLVLQNVSVAISAVAVCLTIYYFDDIIVTWDGWLETLCDVIIIASAVVADVSSMARTISVERDWIVVICEDRETLTEMSAFLRRIDLLTNLLAPIVTGQVITYGSLTIGALFIAAWNLVSVVIEYALLSAVYRSVPELATKNFKDDQKTVLKGDDEEEEEKEEKDERCSLLDKREAVNSYGSSVNENKDIGSEVLIDDDDDDDDRSAAKRCCMLFLHSFVTLYNGWKIYMNQSILFAGLALSTLYMTVIGFDNITSGYAKDQGLSESVVGILMGVGALVGVLGTVLFPRLRAKVGLERTGLLSFAFDVLCLSLCVASVFAPGSPFDPRFLLDGSDDVTSQPVDEVSTTASTSGTEEGVDVSIILLMTGIVISRCALWMADLTVTQLLLECPADNERGIVNGVQNSINKIMDLLKFVLVMAFPRPETFGYLIIASFAFIVLGGCLFAIYSRKVGRGQYSPVP